MEPILLAIWLGLCGVIAAAASNRGRSGFGFFLLSALLSSLVGGLVLLIVGESKPVPTAVRPVDSPSNAARRGKPDAQGEEMGVIWRRYGRVVEAEIGGQIYTFANWSVFWRALEERRRNEFQSADIARTRGNLPPNDGQ